MFQADADITTTDTGVWTEYDGARFLVAHTSNMKFQRSLARLQQPYRRKLEQGTMDPADNKKILCRAMSEGLLLDWEVKDKTGKSVTYTKEAGELALSKQSDFRDYISDFAMNLANFREEEMQELGNS